MQLSMIRWICSECASAILAVGTDFTLFRATLATPRLMDGNCKPTDLLVFSSLALSLRPYGYLRSNIFIPWCSCSSFFSQTFGHTLPFT